MVPGRIKPLGTPLIPTDNLNAHYLCRNLTLVPAEGVGTRRVGEISLNGFEAVRPGVYGGLFYKSRGNGDILGVVGQRELIIK